MRWSHAKLMNIFLAGTMLSSLTVSWPAVAQSPDQNERQREHQGGGDRGQRGQERMERPQNGGARPQQQQQQPGPRQERAAPERVAPERPAQTRPAPEQRAPVAPRAAPQERIAPPPRAAAPDREQRQQDRQQLQEQRQQRQQDRDQRQDQRQQHQQERDQRQDERQQRQEQRQQRKDERQPRSPQDDRRQPAPAPQNEIPRQPRPDDDGARRRDRDDQQVPAARERRDDRMRDGDRRDGNRRDEDGRRDGPGAGPAMGLGGGFLPPTDARRLDDVRRDRRQTRDGDRTFIREPGRTIIEDHGRSFIVHDETARYRALGLNVRRERRGNAFVETIERPNGEQILAYTDVTGRLLRRVRRTRDGREFVLIDNGDAGRLRRYEDDVVVLPLPALGIPRDRYIVDYDDANPNLIYDTLIAPPIAPPPRRYTLDQIRYSPDVRNYVRSVDINTINFDTGSWDVPAAATGQLRGLATAIKRALDRDPNAVFMVEGYTDAVGNADDNLSLSDRRAQSVAEILTKSFDVPPENLVTQGYGEQNLREDTQGPSAVNRRVVVRNITALLATGPAPDNK